MQKYLTRSFYLWLFFSGAISVLYLTAKVSSHILCWMVTDSCRDARNVRNYSASQVQIFGVSEMYKICDGWNVRNRPISCRVWIWILQNLRCLSCKSINFVLLVKSTLMSLFWLFGLCLFGLLFAMYDW